MSSPFAALAAALDRRAAHSPAVFWWRDDDAVIPTPALDRLLALSASHAAPCLVAVIPKPTGPDLAAHLAGRPRITVAPHGWQHSNHAPPGTKKAELGPHRPAKLVLEELSLGLAKLQTLYPDQLAPILVPPWNRIDPDLIGALPGAGFQALSVYGPERPAALPSLNTHVDLMDWHGTGGGRPTASLVSDIVAALDLGLPAIGILSHHLVHDAQAWDFLDQLLALIAGHPGARWASAPDLLAQRRQTG
jgi:hypothetical protein